MGPAAAAIRLGYWATVIVLASVAGGCARGLPEWIADPGGSGAAANDADRALHVADLAARNGDHGSALTLYDGLRRQRKGSPEILIGLGGELVATGAYDEAAAVYRDVLGMDADNLKGLIGLGRVALKQHRGMDAEGYFNRAIALSPDDMTARNGLAVAHDLEGKHSEAEAIYRDILRRHPEDLQARNNLGLCLALQHRPREAVNVLLDVAALPVAPPQARHNLALAYALLGDAGTAAEIERLDLPEAVIATNRAYYVTMLDAPGVPESRQQDRP